MTSIPYSVILTHKNNVLPLSDVHDHQNFCKKFLKAHQTYEKYKNNSKSKITFVNDNVYLCDQNQQNQLDILNWMNSLNQDERLSLFSIKNKWLMNIFSQMFFIYYKMGNYSYKPLSEMCIFFNNQKNYSPREENSNPFQDFLTRILEQKKIDFCTLPPIPNSKKKIDEEKNKKILEINNEPKFDELNLINNFFEINEIIDENYINSDKRKFEKKIIDNIRVICDQNDNFDTITFTKDFIMNIDNIKKFLEFFSENNFFKDWLIPINFKNIYNFVLPSWLHGKNDLSLCQIILGFFEQKIVLNYEYYYYTKKLNELSFDKKISDLYRENQELEKFIYDNYSFNGNDKTKEEIFTSEKIIKSVDELRGDEMFNLKMKVMKDIFNKICEKKACYKGKDIIFDDELSLETYNYLNDEILKGKENNNISKLLDLITFIRFFDIINFKNYIFLNYRKKLINLQSTSLLSELYSDGFLSQKKSGKKHKKKKKKETEEKKSQNVITKTNVINMPVYEVQTNAIECEYNMPQFNMIQENTTNVSINSKTNNNIVITENKKEEIKKPEKKVEITPKKDIEKEKPKENVVKNEEINNKNNDCNDLDINKDKTKEKKGKDFFLFPTSNNNNKKKVEKNENPNTIINNEIKTKNKKNKNKKNKNITNNIIKQDSKDKKDKPMFKFNNYVQERKNIVQINPCPRRKKHFLLQTSSMNFEMHMKPPKYNPSFNMNKKPPQNIDNKNINTINTSQKSHWDYFQYNNNQANSLQIFNSFIPSEKYFDSLDKELNNYINVTNNNISLLKNIQEENLKNLENFLQEKLSDNYEIKFGHYGSFFTELNIEGSDLDILIYYKKKKEENDIIKDILIILKEYLPQLDNIMPILTASVPVIKLQIDIKDEIKELKLKQTSYFEEDDLNKIKIDITFTENEKDFLNSQNTVNYIKNSVKDYPQIKPMLQILKRYFKIMGMNKSYTGGLCSYSLFLLVLSFCKCNKQCLSPTKLLYYFMENFTYFDYCNYCIDVKSENCYILKEKEKIEFNLENNEKSISEENSSFDTNYDLYEKEEIFIVDPISNNNVSKSSFRVDEIILTFRKGFNLLYYEGWYYDCYNNNGIINDNKIIENINELYQEDETSNYMTIKKLFNLKVLKNNFDFYFN